MIHLMAIGVIYSNLVNLVHSSLISWRILGIFPVLIPFLKYSSVLYMTCILEMFIVSTIISELLWSQTHGSVKKLSSLILKFKYTYFWLRMGFALSKSLFEVFWGDCFFLGVLFLLFVVAILILGLVSLYLLSSISSTLISL